jgi:uncharacterized protein (TIGR02246 family)
MTLVVILLATVLIVPAAHAQIDPKARELEPALRALLTELDARWNARDADGMSRLFMAETDFRIWGTRHHRSREEFRQHYAQAFPRVPPAVRHATSLSSLRVLAPGVVLLDGEVVVTDPGRPEGERRFDYAAVALWRDGVWLFDVFRVAQQQKKPAG